MDSQEHPMNAADVLSTMLFALEQGISPAELLDENSPLMDEARRVLKPVDPATQTDAQPVAWLAAYVNNVGLPDHYVTTHHELAVENDANRSPKPLFFNPPTTHEPMAWIDSMGHPQHLSAIQGVREKQLYGPWRPLYD